MTGRGEDADNLSEATWRLRVDGATERLLQQLSQIRVWRYCKTLRQYNDEKPLRWWSALWNHDPLVYRFGVLCESGSIEVPFGYGIDTDGRLYSLDDADGKYYVVSMPDLRSFQYYMLLESLLEETRKLDVVIVELKKDCNGLRLAGDFW